MSGMSDACLLLGHRVAGGKAPGVRQLRLLLLVAVSIAIGGPRNLASAEDYYIGLILEPLPDSEVAVLPQDSGTPVNESDVINTLVGLPAPAAAFELAIKEINQMDTLLNGSTLHILYNSSQYSAQATRQAALWQLRNSNPVAFFGTWYYETTEALATISSTALVPHVSSVARADDLSDDSYPTFVRATAGDSSIADGLVAVCLHFGWDRVAVLHAGNSAGSTLAQRLAQRAVDVGISEMDSFPYATTDDRSALGEALKTTLRRLKDSPHKIVILDIEVRFLIEFFAYWYGEGMHTAGYTILGTEQWTADFFDLYKTFQPSIQAYTDAVLRGLVYLSSDPAAARNASQQQQRPEAARYEALARAWYDNNETRIINERVLTPTALRTWDSAFLIARAIQALEDKGANVRDGQTLLDEILRTSFMGASGNIELDPKKRQLKISWNLLSWEVNTAQGTDPGVYIGSYDADNGTISLVKNVTWADGTTNVPLDRDRVVVSTAEPQVHNATAIELRQTSPDVQLAAIVIAAVGAFVVLGHGVGLLAYRKTPIFRAASSSLLWLVLLGALCGLASAVIIALDFTPGGPIELSRDDVDTLCKVQPFLLGSAFVLTFGVLLATAHRITSIFRVTSSYSRPKSNSKAAIMAVIISDRQLLGAVFALWLVDMLINTAWVQSGDLALSSQSVTSTIEYNSCGSADTRGWLWVSIAYKAVLLVATLLKATATRNVPAAFNSSTIVAMATYNVVIFSLVSIPLSLFAAENVGFAQPFRVAALGFCSLALVGMLIGQKIFVAMFTPEKNKVDGTTTGRAAGSRVSRIAGASGGHTGGSSSSAVELPTRTSKSATQAV